MTPQIQASERPHAGMVQYLMAQNSRVSTATVVLTLLPLLVLMVVLEGCPVPCSTEMVYLLTAYKQFHPEFLLNDWTFSIPQVEHRAFEVLSGLAMLILPLEIFGWIGRFVSWFLIALALYKIGRRYELPSWMIGAGIALWLVYDQSLVGQEYMVGGFESKSVAYVFLLFAINGLLDGRYVVPGLFLGLTFTFHPAVGMWGGLAAGLTLRAIRVRIKDVAVMAAFASIGALPALVLLLPTVLGNAGGTIDDWKYLILVRFSYHFDPLSWTKRDIVLTYTLFVFSWLHSRRCQANQSIRFLTMFQGVLCLFFTAGIVLRVGEQYQWLKFMPMRLFPEFCLLLFFFHLMHAYRYSESVRLGTGTVLVGLLALLGLKNPLGEFVDKARFNYVQWTQGDTDLQLAYKWFPVNSPNGSIVIAPPWQDDSVYLTQRAQVAYWGYSPPGHLSEWRARVRALVPDEWELMPGDTYAQQMEPLYSKLTEAEIAAVVKEYGGDYLVSKGEYSYPVLFQSGSYKIYELPSLKQMAGEAPHPSPSFMLQGETASDRSTKPAPR